MTRNEMKRHCIEVTQGDIAPTSPRGQRLFEEHALILELLQSEKDLQAQNKELDLLLKRRTIQYEAMRIMARNSARAADEARAALRNQLADERIISLYENEIIGAIELSGGSSQDSVWVPIYQALTRAARIVHGDDELEDGKPLSECSECRGCDGNHKMDCSKRGAESLVRSTLRRNFHEAFPDGGLTHDGPNCGVCGGATELIPKSALPEQLRQRMSFVDYVWCSTCGQLMAVGKVGVQNSTQEALIERGYSHDGEEISAVMGSGSFDDEEAHED